MLGTFDLDDVDVRSPDEILSTLAPERTFSGPDDPPPSPAHEWAVTRDIPAVEDVQSDEILRELEEHHQRGQTTARPSAPRGSAELQPTLRHKAPPTRKREVGGRAFRESKPRSRRKRAVFSLAAAGVLTVSASAVTLAQLGRTANRAPTPIRSSKLAATTAFTLTPTKLFDTMANGIAAEERELTRRVTAPARHYARRAIGRKRSTHLVVTHATAARVASSSATSSIPSYSSSSSAPASSSQPATSTAAVATSSNTSNQTQPVFGQDGSLGPGRGAPGTQ